MTAANLPTALTDSRLADLVEESIVYRTRSGAPALSLDGGDTLHDPRGRKVPAVGAWSDTDDDPDDVWADLTDDQRQAAHDTVQHAQAMEARAAQDADDLAAYRQRWGGSRTGRLRQPVPARPSRDDAHAQLKALMDGGFWPSMATGVMQLHVGGVTFYRSGYQLCIGFIKRRGYRIWLLPVTLDQAADVAVGLSRVCYWTNSKRAEVVRN